MTENTIEMGEPLSFGSLTVYPLYARSTALEYQLLDEGLAAGTVKISELNESGSVPELMVENRGDSRLLLLEGEELVGAKQNRILNTSVLVPARSQLRIPVSCVERGRWRYDSHNFGTSGHHSSWALRRVLARSVSHSLGKQRGCRSDQMRVWEEIEAEQSALAVASCTAAMSDTFKSISASVKEFNDNLPSPPSASGMLVAIGSQFVALDLFDSERTCRHAWTRMLTGYTVDALRGSEEKTRPTQDQARDCLERLTHATWTPVETVGDGQEYRADSMKGENAIKLCLDDCAVHSRVLFEALS